MMTLRQIKISGALIFCALITLSSCDCYQSVTGSVVDKNSGKPITGAIVINTANNHDQSTTDSLGRFKIASISGGFHCPPMKIAVKKAGYSVKELEIPAGGHAKIEMGSNIGYMASDTSFVSTTKALKSDTIPGYVFLMRDLRELSIAGMDCDFSPRVNCWMIEEIPKQIANLVNLDKLSFTLNAITKLPYEITFLKNLKTLDLTDNSTLNDIEYITQLENLEELSLFGCNISKLPSGIGNLKKLKYLGLTGNSISPEELLRIKKLLPNCEIIHSN